MTETPAEGEKHNEDKPGKTSSRVWQKGNKEDSYKYGSEDTDHLLKVCLRDYSLQDIKEFSTVRYNTFTHLILFCHVELDKPRAR